MKKLNSIVYEKLILQAEEAKEQNMTKLSSAILGSLTASPETENVTYSSGELNIDVYQDLWKTATNVIKYYNLESVDAEKVNETIEILANKFITELESTLGVPEGSIGPLEEKLPGESK
jgi:exoribonuclease R